jgi:hypothetical protein
VSANTSTGARVASCGGLHYGRRHDSAPTGAALKVTTGVDAADRAERGLGPFATLAARSTLAIPTCPRGRRALGPMLNRRVGRRVSVSQEC